MIIVNIYFFICDLFFPRVRVMPVLGLHCKASKFFRQGCWKVEAIGPSQQQDTLPLLVKSPSTMTPSPEIPIRSCSL